MDYALIALFDGTPVAVAHNREDMEMLLAEYTQGTLVEYKAYNSKYPSINDYEGSYYYDEAHTNEVLEFKIFSVNYLGEDEKPKLNMVFKAGWIRANAMTYDEKYFEYFWKNEYKK